MQLHQAAHECLNSIELQGTSFDMVHSKLACTKQWLNASTETTHLLLCVRDGGSKMQQRPSVMTKARGKWRHVLPGIIVACTVEICFTAHHSFTAACVWPPTASCRRCSACDKTVKDARHTSHVTRHMSHVTCHTSHVTRHTSHVACSAHANGLDG